MKKFFKKIAFVSAMAMVVSNMPAQSAAAAEGPQMYESLKFYLGGDVTETYSDEARYAKVWNKDGYTVEFDIDNEDVATVSKKGKVTPVGVGTATVTATFTDEDGEEVEKTCVVTVKKNAADVEISDASAEALKNLTVGDTYQTKTARYDADGNVSWKGKDAITDAARFESSNTDVFTVTKKGGYVKAVGAGEAELYVWTVQFEGAKKDADGNVVEYKATTEKVKYDVVVKGEGILSAKQVSYNTVAITCGSKDVAAEIAKDITKLNAVYVVGNNEVMNPVKEAKVDANDATVVNVTLYANLNKDVTYKFTYGETSVSVVGADLGAVASIAIVTTKAEALKETQIAVKFYDANGVEILAGSNVLSFSADDSVDYYLDPATGKITFWEIGKSATVTAKYDMGYDNNGNEIPALTHTAVIVSAADAVAGDVLGWYIDAPGINAGDNSWKFGTGATTLAVADGAAAGKQVYVKFKNTEFDGTVNDKFNVSSNADQLTGDTYSYKSTNDNVVMVDTATGIIYPVSAGTAQIIVNKVVGDTEVVVCVITIKVVANRTLTTLTVTPSQTKLSDSADDSVTLKLTAKDQLGDQFVLDDTNVTFEIVKDYDNATVTTVLQDSDWDGAGDVTTLHRSWEDFSTILLDGVVTSTSAKTVQVKVTAVDSAHNVKLSKVVSLQVKAFGAHASYAVEVSKDKIDLNLVDFNSWEDATKYESVITLKSFDSQGFLREVKSLDYAAKADITKGLAAGYYFTILRGNDEYAANVADTTFKALTVSGPAENATIGDVTKIGNGWGTGTHTVRVYEGMGADKDPKLIGIKNIVVSDTTPSVLPVVNSNKLTSAEAAAVVDGAAMPDGKLTLKRNGKDITVTILSTEATQNLGSDNKIKTVFVKSITVRETYHGKLAYTYTVNVGKTFYVAD